MDRATNHKCREALAEALVLIGIARAEAQGYITESQPGELTTLVELKRKEVDRLKATEAVLMEMSLELTQGGLQ